MREQWYVRSWIFSREVRLGTNDEVAGFEVIEGGENLWGVESWVQRYEYGTQLEERVCRLYGSQYKCSACGSTMSSEIP